MSLPGYVGGGGGGDGTKPTYILPALEWPRTQQRRGQQCTAPRRHSLSFYIFRRAVEGREFRSLHVENQHMAAAWGSGVVTTDTKEPSIWLRVWDLLLIILSPRLLEFCND